MEKIVVLGGTPLKGEVSIIGAKNSVLAILPASLLINGTCTINNVPNISDVKIICNILLELGSKIKWNSKNSLTIDNTNICPNNIPLDLTSKFRASYYLLGAMLGRCGTAEVGIPGGCNLGARPIDQHIKGFELLGANVETTNGKVSASADKLVGNNINLDVVSVGATLNIMLAATLASGTTIIENAAKEPHVVDVATFLNSVGADIRGAGTDIIKINGVKKLHSDVSYSVVPDQIETGTFMLATVATKGDVLIKNCVPEHMDSVISKLIEIGANIDIKDDTIRVSCNSRPNKSILNTLPYPGFPTDLQSPMGVILSIADGTSIINESIWDSRFQYAAELNKMGAKFTVQGKSAIVEGVENLYGAPVYVPDLRAGAALIIAGLAAKGKTEIYNLHHIDRGYENIVEKFKCLGANIERIKDDN